MFFRNYRVQDLDLSYKHVLITVPFKWTYLIFLVLLKNFIDTNIYYSFGLLSDYPLQVLLYLIFKTLVTIFLINIFYYYILNINYTLKK